MRYQKALWKHSDSKYPKEILSEINDEMWEVRKVEVFFDGRMFFSDGRKSTGDTILADQLMPSVEELSENPEFDVVDISKKEFEKKWIETQREFKKEILLDALTIGAILSALLTLLAFATGGNGIKDILALLVGFCIGTIGLTIVVLVASKFDVW